MPEAQKENVMKPPLQHRPQPGSVSASDSDSHRAPSPLRRQWRRLDRLAEGNALSSFGPSLQLVHNRCATSLRHDLPQEVASAKEFDTPADDGLGFMRGLAIAMLCNLSLVLVIAAGWVLWGLPH